MKQKIFQKLKQGFSNLGLGDEVLQAHAESLAALGLVTDENIDNVVNAQKPFLESLQKNYDTRVTSATAKAKEAAKKEFEDAAKETARKEREERERQEKEKRERQEKEKEMPDWYKAEKEASDKTIKELLASVKTMKEGYDAMKSENDKFKAEKTAAERKNSIISKAKELGIPQYRIDEGFAIADDADESKITEYLTKVATNTKLQTLPSNRGVYPLSDGAPSKENVDAIAKAMVK